MTSKMDAFFAVQTIFFHSWPPLGPSWLQMPPRGPPREHFRAFLLILILFRSFLWPAQPPTKGGNPMQHTKQNQKKGSIPPCHCTSLATLLMPPQQALPRQPAPGMKPGGGPRAQRNWILYMSLYFEVIWEEMRIRLSNNFRRGKQWNNHTGLGRARWREGRRQLDSLMLV